MSAWIAATNGPSGNVLGVFQDDNDDIELCHVIQDFENPEYHRSLRIYSEDIPALIRMLTNLLESGDLAIEESE